MNAVISTGISVTPLLLKDALIIRPKEFKDHRGVFLKLYTSGVLSSSGVKFNIAEDYLTRSGKGVLRGLHFQTGSHSQAKLITCMSGKIFDVMVDLRKNSRTFGRWQSIVLSAEKPETLYIPRGFAHGNLTLEANTLVSYKADNPYSAAHESGILWSDRDLSIPWPEPGSIVVSEKDGKLPVFRKTKYFD